MTPWVNAMRTRPSFGLGAIQKLVKWRAKKARLTRDRALLIFARRL